MSMRLLHSTWQLVAMATVIGAMGAGSTTAYAQCGCGQHGGGHAGHGAGPTAYEQATARGHVGHDHTPSAEFDPAQTEPPHGGQLTSAGPMEFEVVYLPREVRVYLYRAPLEPETARDVSGEATLQLRGDQRATRLALRYFEPANGQQDYLSAPVDLSRVKDGDFVATLKLSNLPLQNRPGITFAQPVVLAKAGPQVTLAAVEASDQAAVARQRVCPVTGAPLGSMGGPVKVLVGGEPLYLCCKGCLDKVQSAPEAYLEKVAHTLPSR